jgi:hypothetical protein
VKKKLSIFIAIVVALAVVMLGTNMAASDGFDSRKWKAEEHNTSRNNPRIGMVVPLMKILRVGMTRSEVAEFLGAPDNATDNKIEYELGASPYGIDYETFFLEFDGNGKLESFRIKRG